MRKITRTTITITKTEIVRFRTIVSSSHEIENCLIDNNTIDIQPESESIDRFLLSGEVNNKNKEK